MGFPAIKPLYTFTDIDGTPLNDGYLYFGTANADPEASPIQVYWDAAQTVPATQPIRTIGGYPVNAGARSVLYVPSDYSINVQNKNGTLVYTSASEVNDNPFVFKQTGTGAVAIQTTDKLKSVAVSPIEFGAVGDGVADDTTAIANAVAYCNTNGFVLNLTKTYLTTASIPNFHSIFKIGKGTVKRGASTFYITPASSQSNTLYLSTTGNDSNDGLTSSQPFATLQAALDALEKYGPALRGTWTISAAAGTYSQGNVNFPVIISNENRVVIQGPIVNHPNVPTAIFDGGSSLAYGLNFNSRGYVTISNIKFQNYVTYGIVAQDFPDIVCTNVHLQNILGDSGVKVQQGRLRFFGGIVTGCRTGISCIAGTIFTIGDSTLTSLANGTQFINCTVAGVQAQEQSSGHTDYCTIDNCVIGLEAVVASRFHVLGCDIKNNITVGIRCRQDSSWFDNGNTFTNNATNELTYSFGGEVARDGSRTSELRQAIDLVFVTNTGALATTAVKTYSAAIYPNSFSGQSKAYRMKIYGTITGTAGTKNITVTIAGGTAWGFTIPAAAAGDYVIEGVLYAFNALGTQQSYYATCMVNGQTIQVAQGARGLTMLTGANIPAVINLTINGAGDTVAIRGVDQYNMGGC